ncbi:murein DD-endopeptidase MepM/ murein hydrolase activator NlpD [Roseateles asaccharophilus]|uniref:M23 family metallopeptidase n=1 Tax=Roseateles asaccharophilus TaxID=582607 RepID=UPI00383429CB
MIRAVRLAFAVVSGAISAAGILAPVTAYAQGCIQVPVTCSVTSAFGPRFNPITKNYSSEYHHGIDFGCPIGTSVVAADAGVVNVSGFSQSAGNWVVVRSSGNGPTIKYMHHERNFASIGNLVEKGQQLALTGNTGRSTGPHLHFQVEAGGQAVDPMARFCSKPTLREGVLQGASPPQSDIVDAGSQTSTPDGGAPPAMGMEGSIHEVLGDLVASRAMNPDYVRQLASLTEPRLYAELAYMKAIRLKVQHERSQHRERIEATQAMLEILMTDSVLRPQLDSQRAAATRAATNGR